jgi:hypothetical protein
MWGAGTGAAPGIMKQNASTRATTSSAHATPRRHPARSLDSWSHPVRSSSGESHRVRARRGSLATGPGIQTGRSGCRQGRCGAAAAAPSRRTGRALATTVGRWLIARKTRSDRSGHGAHCSCGRPRRSSRRPDWLSGTLVVRIYGESGDRRQGARQSPPGPEGRVARSRHGGPLRTELSVTTRRPGAHGDTTAPVASRCAPRPAFGTAERGRERQIVRPTNATGGGRA